MIELYECTNCGALLHPARTHRFCSGLYPRSDADLGLNLMAKRARRKLAAHLRLDEEMNRGRVKRPGSMRGRLLKVALRDGPECRGCGTDEELTVDHILPLSRGGTNHLDNLQILCETCNGAKGSKTMAEWKGQRDA